MTGSVSASCDRSAGSTYAAGDPDGDAWGAGIAATSETSTTNDKALASFDLIILSVLPAAWHSGI
jgi:hypothetical protein